MLKALLHCNELCSADCEQFLEITQLVHTGIQATGTDKEFKGELESELCGVKEQLRGMQISIAHLLEWVERYRYKWLEEYHCAKDLELHMPDGTYVPHLDQIPQDAPSPGFKPEL
ncbi:hypothetical protein BDR07DRAFT_1380044 [Suillus spraguei]|nr:hypothetical protein BDR07DRAFT_1380044 [Suillus spraguei]